MGTRSFGRSGLAGKMGRECITILRSEPVAVTVDFEPRFYRAQDLPAPPVRQGMHIYQLVLGLPGVQMAYQAADPAEVQAPGLC